MNDKTIRYIGIGIGFLITLAILYVNNDGSFSEYGHLTIVSFPSWSLGTRYNNAELMSRKLEIVTSAFATSVLLKSAPKPKRL
jgi:hypothetical protein